MWSMWMAGLAAATPPGSSWTGLQYQPYARFGNAVAVLDADGDGVDDVAAVADLFDATLRDEGRLTWFAGGPAGLGPRPDVVLDGGVREAEFGGGLASAGDVNGDGFDDLLVGAPLFGERPALRRGAAGLFLGGPAGPAPAPAWVALGAADDRLGSVVAAAAGDVNGDGYDDLAVGVEPRFFSVGEVRVYLGGPLGPGAAPHLVVRSPIVTDTFGWTIAFVGDLNGDGFDELAIGDFTAYEVGYESGIVYLWYGAATGLSATADQLLHGGIGYDSLGIAVLGAGDVNGDGFGDLLASYSGRDNGVAVYHGSAAGVLPTPSSLVPGAGNIHHGETLAALGDTNGDGFDDVAVAAELGELVTQNEGVVELHLGSAAGLRSAPAGVLRSAQPMSSFGHALAAGDTDADGRTELFVGAPGWDGGSIGEGAVFRFEVP